MGSDDAIGDALAQRDALRLWVARAKVGAAVIAFCLATWLGHRAGLDWVDAGLRGLVAAAVFALVGWLCALLVINAFLRTVAINRRDEERRMMEKMAAARAKARADAQAAAAVPGAPGPGGEA